jgi:hypothetical protein
MAERQPPRFRGVRTYKDPKGRFSFRYPSDWHKFELLGDREGIMCSPESDNPQTFFSVWVSLLDESVVAEDAEELRLGVDQGLSDLPESNIEAEREDVLGNLIKFERVFTFNDNGAIRKRKFWILYVDKWLIVVTWQGADAAEYHYWYPMANYSFNTFNLPETLWFSTDRDLSSSSR